MVVVVAVLETSLASSQVHFWEAESNMEVLVATQVVVVVAAAVLQASSASWLAVC